MGCLKLLHNELHLAQEPKKLRVVYRKPKQNSHYRYLHRDHLGSILAITDNSGNILEQRHFGAWGFVEDFKKNRQTADFSQTLLRRGFTGHEHFEEVDVIHMNGRMYNPRTHRFVTPDNFIQDPYNTMSYDRQAYVWNNPLMNTDPSGEIALLAIAFKIAKAAAVIMTAHQVARTIGGYVTGYYTGAGQLFSTLFSIGVGLLAAGVQQAIFSSAATTLGGEIARHAVAGALGFVTGTLGAVVSGASLKDAIRAGANSAGTAVAMNVLKRYGAKVNAQESSSNNADTDVKKRLEATAKQASEEFQAKMKKQNYNKLEQFASDNAVTNLELGTLKDKYSFGIGKSPFRIIEKSLISFGEGVVGSYGSTTIKSTRNAPIGLQGQSISSNGFSLGGEIGTPIGLFSQVSGQIHFDQPVRGSNIHDLFKNTEIIHARTTGSIIKFTNIQGFDSAGKLLWHASTKGTCLCASIGGNRYPFNLK